MATVSKYKDKYQYVEHYRGLYIEHYRAILEHWAIIGEFENSIIGLLTSVPRSRQYSYGATSYRLCPDDLYLSMIGSLIVIKRG